MALVDIDSLDKTTYENISGHVIGVVILDHDGKPAAIGVKPGDTIALNEIEQRLTRNAPKSAEDNPFANGDLTVYVENRKADEPVIDTAESVQTDQEADQVGVDTPPNPEDLPQGALPAGQPRTEPGSLKEVASEAAKAAKATGEAPSDPSLAPPEDIEEEVAVEVETHTQEIGAAVEPAGHAPEGEFAKDEEVGTPDAPAKPKPPVNPPKKKISK